MRDTGAILNTNWSIEILHNYANHIKDHYSIIKGPFYYYVKINEVGYICYIMLPATAIKRFFRGNCCSTKDNAKRSACFYAVFELYKIN